MNALKRIFAPVDMTVGKPWEDILLFTIPMLIGNIAQQLYNTVDSVVVGNYVGDNALAAVGSAGPILNLLIVLFIGISVGASIMVSQYFGGRRREDLSIAIANSIVLTGIASIVVMIMATLAARPLLVLLKTPASIMLPTFEKSCFFFAAASLTAQSKSSCVTKSGKRISDIHSKLSL